MGCTPFPTIVESSWTPICLAQDVNTFFQARSYVQTAIAYEQDRPAASSLTGGYSSTQGSPDCVSYAAEEDLTN